MFYSPMSENTSISSGNADNMTEYLIIRNLFVSNMKLDSNDLKIIELLKQDSRASVTSIAEALG